MHASTSTVLAILLLLGGNARAETLQAPATPPATPVPDPTPRPPVSEPLPPPVSPQPREQEREGSRKPRDVVPPEASSSPNATLRSQGLARIAADPRLRDLGLVVEANGNVLHVVGSVPDETTRARVLAVVADLPGRPRIDASKLTIQGQTERQP